MTTKVSSCKSFSIPLQAKLNKFRVIGQVGFPPLWSRRSRRGCLRLGASISGSGIGGSQDAVEEEKQEKGLILGTERDGSGSVIEFHLIPQSGIPHISLYLVEYYIYSCHSFSFWNPCLLSIMDQFSTSMIFKYFHRSFDDYQ